MRRVGGKGERRKGKERGAEPSPARLVTLHDVERAAKRRLPKAVYDHLRSGADAERTLAANEAAFQRRVLWPRTGRDVRGRELATRVLGVDVAMPILVAPMGYHRLVDPEGELATARAAAAAGTILAISELASVRLEDVATATPSPKWLQLCVVEDRARTRALVERAAAAGYQAIVVTVDVPVLGRRPRDVRAGFAVPAELALVNHREPTAEGAPGAEGSAPVGFDAVTPDAGFTFADLEWLRSIAPLPLVVKGILRGDDADLAARHGAAAIVVSNHGGRQLDGAPASLDALPEVAAAVAGRCEVLMDGGVRSGTDVLTALALGARAVLVGRPVLYGLAIGGEAGARRVLEMLRDELSAAMALAGCRTIEDIDAGLVHPAPR
jgi:4-hydroxymandelate oxidase